MAAVTASTTATGSSKLCSWRLEKPPSLAKNSIALTKLAIHSPLRFSAKRMVDPIRALDPQKDGKEEDSSSSISQEDLAYLLKLAAGSVAGAGMIKYGSIAFPEITRPNIIVAFIIISTPVVIAVLLLINQSRADGPS